MLEALELHRYRGFETYRLTDLACVNLVVGKNNCGKTSILEALELLFAGGRTSALWKSLGRRGEFDDKVRFGVDVSHVFYGHRCRPGASFELSSPGSGLSLQAKVLSLDEVDEATADRWSVNAKRRRFDPDEEPPVAYGLSLASEGSPTILLPIAENGALLDRHWVHDSGNGGRMARFLNFEQSSMGDAWNDVLAEGREKEIVEAMRILMPRIDSIHFLTGDRRKHGILLGERDVKHRLPLGSYGDGMRRLLAISLALATTKSGCLLIDEIDTGLHWTVMEDMWQLVAEAAKRSNTQVFATTHSSDCIRGLGTLIRSRPDLAGLVTVQKVHASLQRAVCVAGEEVSIAVEQGIEVR